MLITQKHSQLRGLYAITQDGLPQTELYNKTEAILANGAQLLQYRDKSGNRTKRLEQALWLKQCCDEYNCLFIINDDVELADEVSADGVHLGSDDTVYAQARDQLGPDAIIGLSCYNQLDLANNAQTQGASYAAFGACFPSSTKPYAPSVSLELIQQATAQLNIPVCCIGGINLEKAPQLIAANADMLAVISDLYGSEHPGLVTRQYRELFKA